MTDKTGSQQEEEARALLDRLGAERKKLEAKLDDVQKETHDAIVDVLMARTLGPSEVGRRVQYDRQHVARIAKKANVPPLRKATVVSRKAAEGRPPVAPAAATSRQQVTQAVPVPAADNAFGLTTKEIRHLLRFASAQAKGKQPELLSRAGTTAKARGLDPDIAMLDAAYEMGLVKDTDVAAVREQTASAPTRPAADANEEN